MSNSPAPSIAALDKRSPEAPAGETNGATATDMATVTKRPRRDPLTGLYQQDYLSLVIEQTIRRSDKSGPAATLGLLQLKNFYEIRSWVADQKLIYC